MSKTGQKSILLIERERSGHPEAYYYVKIKWQGKQYHKTFSVSQYKTREEALAAAIAWRDETEKAIGKPRTNRQVIGISRRNKTGIVGASFVTVPVKENGKVVRKPKHIQVTWSPEPGVIRRTSISIDKYGLEEAKRIALELRRKAEEDMYGGTLDQVLEQKDKAAKKPAAKPAAKAAPKKPASKPAAKPAAKKPAAKPTAKKPAAKPAAKKPAVKPTGKKK